MTYSRLQSPLLYLFNEDIRKNKQYTYRSQLIFIIIKSLIPSKKVVGNKIDSKRFKEELKLWYWYRKGDNKSLLNAVKFYSNEIYWDEIDDTAIIRQIPIVFSNSNWDIIKDEILKNILYTTGNICVLLETLLYSKILFLLLNNEKDIILKLKDEIINFSQKEFLGRYKDFIRSSIDSYNKNYYIDFERIRIQLISVLNGKNISKFKKLNDCINFIENNKIDQNSHFLCKLLFYLNNEFNDDKVFDQSFIEKLSIYLYKLRKGQIYPDKLQITKYYLPDVFQFKQNETFYHSLLNKCIVVKKDEDLDKILILVKTKSGIYEFKKYKRPSK